MLGSTLLAIAAMEMLAALYLRARAKFVPVVGQRVYTMRSNLSTEYGGRDLTTNSMGMRDRPRSWPKAKDTYRVLVVGDSHVYGFGVPAEAAFPQQLERELNSRADKTSYEVWNAGVCGYNAAQATAAAQYFARCKPNAIVVCAVENDVCSPQFLHESGYSCALLNLMRMALGRFGPRGAAASERSARMGRLVMAPRDPNTLNPTQNPSLLDHRYRELVGADAVRRAYRDIRGLADRLGARALYFVDYLDIDLKREGLAISETERDMLQWATEAGLEIVDMRVPFAQYLRASGLRYDSLCVSRTDRHGNQLRNRIIAEELASRLVRGGGHSGARPGRP